MLKAEAVYFTENVFNQDFPEKVAMKTENSVTFLLYNYNSENALLLFLPYVVFLNFPEMEKAKTFELIFYIFNTFEIIQNPLLKKKKYY